MFFSRYKYVYHCNGIKEKKIEIPVFRTTTVRFQELFTYFSLSTTCVLFQHIMNLTPLKVQDTEISNIQGLDFKFPNIGVRVKEH